MQNIIQSIEIHKINESLHLNTPQCIQIPLTNTINEAKSTIVKLLNKYHIYPDYDEEICEDGDIFEDDTTGVKIAYFYYSLIPDYNVDICEQSFNIIALQVPRKCLNTPIYFNHYFNNKLEKINLDTLYTLAKTTAVKVDTYSVDSEYLLDSFDNIHIYINDEDTYIIQFAIQFKSSWIANKLK